jgi:cellulose biosynthesis protein BcsQ
MVDLDPQANLSIICLDERRLAEIWGNSGDGTVYGTLKPIFEGGRPELDPSGIEIEQNLHLLAGDLALTDIEDELSTQWVRCLDGDARSLLVTACFDALIKAAAAKLGSEIVVIDTGPSFGSINRSALVASDFVAVPVVADFFAVSSLRDVGKRLRTWRMGWQERRNRGQLERSFELPNGTMEPIGYIVSRQSVFAGHPPVSSKRWLDAIPKVYREAVEDQPLPPGTTIDNDDRKLAQLKDYRSLMPMAQEARKPMFLLKPADGAIGGHQAAVQDCYRDFDALAETILQRTIRRP